MINDIRFQASKILQFSTENQVQEGNNNLNNAFENSFEDLLLNNNKEIQETKVSGNSCMQLGIPAGFEIDFSLVEELESQKE